MKIAVSIPNAIFEAAEKRARRLGVSRSQLYAQALEKLLAEDRAEALSERLDAVYAAEESALEPTLKRAQRKATAEEW